MNFEKYVSQGAERLHTHNSVYDVPFAEWRAEVISVSDSPSICDRAHKALSRVYSAGIEAGYRMAMNDMKKKNAKQEA